MGKTDKLIFLGDTKMDRARRISLIKIVADRLEAVDGDHIMFFYNEVDGNIVIKKANIEEEPVKILSDQDREDVMLISDVTREMIHNKFNEEVKIMDEFNKNLEFTGSEEEFEKYQQEALAMIKRYEVEIEREVQKVRKMREERKNNFKKK